MRVATDVGGTFTDYVLLSDSELTAFKSLTTPAPSRNILGQLQDKNIHEFSHGTTVAVNSILERTGAKIVFFTTKGFKDLINIGRQARTEVYSFICSKPSVPVEQIVEIDERTSNEGVIIKKISKKALEDQVEQFKSQELVAVVGFINSYANPENEMLAEDILKKYFSLVIPSYKVRREVREYERFCTTVMEGFCAPVVDKYLKKIEPLCKNFYVMQSNGGRIDIDNLKAVNMIMSGPAGGVAATEVLCRKLGIENAIAYDMGGTSADVSAIISGLPVFTDTVNITDIPIKTLAIDIESIGAGGGSIAWLDDGGALKVGPMSVGSKPGPACYGCGGDKFTVSDANLIVGILGKKISEISLDLKRSEAAAKPLCDRLNMTNLELSHGVLKIVNNNMVSAIKKISIGKGYDLREFALVAFGGAGPMHACALAEALGIKRIVIPPFAGAFSAFGILSAPVRFDHVRTILKPLESSIDLISEVLSDFKLELKNKLGARLEHAISNESLDIRYFGQGHEINVPMCDDLANTFHSRHEKLFGFNMPDNPIEVVNVKLVSELLTQDVPLETHEKNSPSVSSIRKVYPEGEVDIYRKDFHGFKVDGPCIIEDDTTTVYVESGWVAELGVQDILQLERD